MKIRSRTGSDEASSTAPAAICRAGGLGRRRGLPHERGTQRAGMAHGETGVALRATGAASSAPTTVERTRRAAPRRQCGLELPAEARCGACDGGWPD